MNEPAAVDYLLSSYPEWSKIYDLFRNHLVSSSRPTFTADDYPLGM